MTWKKVKIGEIVESYSIKFKDFPDLKNPRFCGVSNSKGIIDAKNSAEDKIDDYKIISKGVFAYNPYRINVGSIAIYNEENPAIISPAYVLFKATKILPELLLRFLKSNIGLDEIRKNARGSVRQALRFADLCNIEIDLPPIEEQKKIVQKINSIQPIQDEITTNTTHQQTLLKKLKAQILQEAIEGKLTQKWRQENPNLEPASNLLKKIKAEKPNQSTKKSKPLPPITDSEKPFKIPKTWTWCRLGEVITMNYGKGLSKSQTTVNDKYPVFGSNGIVGYYNKFLTKNNSIIIGRKGSAGALNISYLPSWTTDVAYYVEENEYTNFKYEYYLLLSLELEKLGRGIKPGLNRSEAYNTCFPLPPLAEQQEIVRRVDQLMTLCDQLETQIQNTQTYSKSLMQSVLGEVLEG